MFYKILNEYQSGEFTFTNGSSIYTVCNAPKEGKGVYIHIGITREGREIVLCIGKAGTFSNQRNGFKDQALYGRLTATRGEISAQNYFDAILLGGFASIKIRWYVTYDQNTKHVPAYVEANLLQQYFDQNGKLPPYNSCF